jgi:hypothetical protein
LETAVEVVNQGDTPTREENGDQHSYHVYDSGTGYNKDKDENRNEDKNLDEAWKQGHDQEAEEEDAYEDAREPDDAEDIDDTEDFDDAEDIDDEEDIDDDEMTQDASAGIARHLWSTSNREDYESEIFPYVLYQVTQCRSRRRVKLKDNPVAPGTLFPYLWEDPHGYGMASFEAL